MNAAGFEPAIFWSVVRRVIRCATRPSMELLPHILLFEFPPTLCLTLYTLVPELGGRWRCHPVAATSATTRHFFNGGKYISYKCSAAAICDLLMILCELNFNLWWVPVQIWVWHKLYQLDVPPFMGIYGVHYILVIILHSSAEVVPSFFHLKSRITIYYVSRWYRNSWQLGRRRAGQLRFGFVAVLVGHIVYSLRQHLKKNSTF
jgi:hypothetical protein